MTRSAEYYAVVELVKALDLAPEEVISLYVDADSLIVVKRSLGTGIVASITYPMHIPVYITQLGE